MNNKILFLEKGDRVTSKNEYSAIQKEFQDQLSQTTDETLRQNALNLIKSAQSYSSADPMNNRSARQFGIQIYQNAIQYLKTRKQDFLPVFTPSSKNIFGGYSNEENINNANQLTYRFFSQGPNNKNSSNTNTSQNGGNNTKFYQFKWNFRDPAYLLDTDTLQKRIDYFLDGINSGINSVNDAQAKGMSVVGIKKNIIDKFGDATPLISSINENDSDENKLSKLANLANMLNVPPEVFQTYFSQYLPKKSEIDIAKENQTNNGYDFSGNDNADNTELNRLIYQNGYHVGSKDGNLYLFDQAYNPITETSFNVNTDWLDDNYNQYYGVSSNGKITIGDAGTLKHGDQYYQNWQDFIKANKESFDNLYSEYEGYDKTTNYSTNQLVNELADKEISEQDKRKLLNGKWIDVGQYFSGDGSVIAIPKDGNIQRDVYGQLRFDNLKLYYYDNEGKLKSAESLKDAESDLGEFNRLGNGEEPNIEIDFESIKNMLDSNILPGFDENTNVTGRSNWGNWWHIDDIQKENWYKKSNMKFGDNEESVKYILKLLENLPANGSDDSKLLARLGYNDNYEGFIKGLVNMMRKYHIPMNETVYNEILQLKKEKVSENKNGGIIFAKTGASAQIASSDEGKKKAEDTQKYRDENTGKSNQDIAKERQSPNFETADYLRFGALAQDILSTIAAVSGPATGGVGSATAVALGLTSMGTDLAADLIDDKTSKWDAVKNAALNTGFALVSFIPGARMGKMLKATLKLLPTAISVAGTLGIAFDPEVQQSIAKVFNQGKPGTKELTTGDWMNITRALRVVSGAVRTGAGVHTKRQLNKKLESVKSTSDPNIEYVQGKNGNPIPVKKGQKPIIEEALKNPTDAEKVKAANKAMAGKNTINDIEAETSGKWGGLKFWDKEVKGVKSVSNPENPIDKKLLAEALRREDRAVNEKIANSRWARILANTDTFFSGKKGAYTPFQEFGRKTINDYYGQNFTPEYTQQPGKYAKLRNTKNEQAWLIPRPKKLKSAANRVRKNAFPKKTQAPVQPKIVETVIPFEQPKSSVTSLPRQLSIQFDAPIQQQLSFPF